LKEADAVLADLKKQVTLYSDGACSGNPGPGGYGTILCYKNIEKEISEGFTDTTNNRCELLGVINGLKLLKESCNVTVYTDSQYVVNGIEKGWAKSWKAKGWKKSDNSPALNVDLWEELLALTDKHTVNFIWVKGHNGHPYNERCDNLAVEATAKIKANL
jgi:Ribonuclease HI